MSFEVRRATLEDAEAIAQVLRASFEEFRGAFDPPSGAIDETGESVREAFVIASCYLAEDDGRPVGCVFCKHKVNHIYLYRLGVLPDARRGGIGRALMQAVEDETRRAGLTRVRLGTRYGMQQNVRYYEGLGYVQVSHGLHPVNGGPCYVHLEKVLYK
jgi:ribosomal protein S18 acetylase RimI-like enzyme